MEGRRDGTLTASTWLQDRSHCTSSHPSLPIIIHMTSTNKQPPPDLPQSHRLHNPRRQPQHPRRSLASPLGTAPKEPRSHQPSLLGQHLRPPRSPIRSNSLPLHPRRARRLRSCGARTVDEDLPGLPERAHHRGQITRELQAADAVLG